MATIRERGGKFHVQVRMKGFPSQTATFPTRRLAKRWGTIVEAEMIEARYFKKATWQGRTSTKAVVEE